METNRILAELNAERARLDRAIVAIEGLNSTGQPRAGRPPSVTPKRRAFSAATRARMAAAQRARWARARAVRAQTSTAHEQSRSAQNCGGTAGPVGEGESPGVGRQGRRRSIAGGRLENILLVNSKCPLYCSTHLPNIVPSRYETLSASG